MKALYTSIDYIRILMILVCVLAAIGLGVFLYPCFRNASSIPTNQEKQELIDSEEIQKEVEPIINPSIPH